MLMPHALANLMFVSEERHVYISKLTGQFLFFSCCVGRDVGCVSM